MSRKILLVALVFMLMLTACEWNAPAIPPRLFTSSAPSGTPAIQSATPLIVTSTALGAGNTPAVSATATATPTLVPTATTALPDLSAGILRCKTSLDLLHQMGEVTNALVIIRNRGAGPATNVCATLSASDEDRPHPDKTACTAALAAGYQVTFKLTVDTGYKEDTSIKVTVASDQGVSTASEAPSCRDLGMSVTAVNEPGVPEPIP